MPKKYTPSYTKTSSSYVHPSLQSSREPSSSSPPPPRSVNERIQQLRREQAPRSNTERINEFAELVNQRTVPPALRRILNIPEVNPPRQKDPRPASIQVGAVRARRPPPGPAAPTSWSESSRHTPAFLRKLVGLKLDGGDHDAREFSFLATVDTGAGQLFPSERSLLHQALKKFALNWEELVEYEQYHLPTLSCRFKILLLCYLTRYGRPGCLNIQTFKILFQTGQDVEGGTGSDEMQFLDLTSLLNEHFTLGDFNKYLNKPKQASSTEPVDAPAPSDLKQKGKGPAVEPVFDSWEEELKAETLLPSIVPVRFPHLTRLSLAKPGNWASWPQLLSISANLTSLTHLSLAYWPTPSLTPNATTASMVNSLTKPVDLGGTSMYSELEDDWHEAANILRRLSNKTYRLQWLDLEGCSWIKALTWKAPVSSPSSTRRLANTWMHPDSGEMSDFDGPDWMGSWRQITYLNVSQGWIPRNQSYIKMSPAGVFPVRILSWLRAREEREEREKENTQNGAEEAGVRDKRRERIKLVDVGDKMWMVDQWMEREKVLRDVEARILMVRKVGKGAYCKVDHGWDPHDV